ncbi:MAG: RHS repeat-associated core domain-containing protein [Planctomycetota bacterium]
MKVTEKDDMGTTTRVVEYTYDVFNRRIAKAIDATSPFSMVDAVIEHYVYDDLNGITSVDGGNVVLDFLDADCSGSSPLTLDSRQLFANAVDQILAQEVVDENISSADRVLWHLADNLATVRDLIKNDGTLGEHYTYDSYGDIESGDATITRYLYTSREHDTDTGLQYNRARWYDAEVGRWISEDPLGFVAGDFSLSRDVANSPITNRDPSGLAGLNTTHPPKATPGNMYLGTGKWDYLTLLAKMNAQVILNHNVFTLCEKNGCIGLNAAQLRLQKTPAGMAITIVEIEKMEIFSKSQLDKAVDQLNKMNKELKNSADPKYQQYVLVAFQADMPILQDVTQSQLAKIANTQDFNVATLLPAPAFEL